MTIVISTILLVILMVVGFIIVLKSNKKDAEFLDSLQLFRIETGHITYNSMTHKFSFYNKTSCVAADILPNALVASN